MSSAYQQSNGRTMPLWRNLAFTAALVGPAPGVLPLFFTLALPAPRVQAAGVDYGKGLEILFELGLPDVSGPDWQYLTLEGRQGSEMEDPFGGRSRSGNSSPEIEALQKTLAHGWVEKPTVSDPTKPNLTYRRVLGDGWRILGTTNEQAAARLMQQAGLQWSPLTPTKDAKAADEKADAKALALGLQGLANSDESIKRSLFYSPDLIVTYLFRAAQYHRRGHKEEAAAAAQALFSLIDRKDRLVDLAVEKLAGTRYDEVMRRFRQNRDWKELDAGLAKLLSTYTRGWTERAVVERLGQLVQQRLATPAGQSPPLLHAASLTPEQQSWWLELDAPPKVKETAKPTEAAPAQKAGEEETNEVDLNSDEAVLGDEESTANFDFSSFSQIWLFGVKMQADPDNLAMWKEQSAAAPAWMRAPIEKDWDWITVMAAGLGDETLVALPGRESYRSSRSFDFESDTPEMTEEELTELWDNLSRPRTRSDLAREFLQVVLPINDEEDDELPTDAIELRQLALDLAKALNGKTSQEIARFYLKGGSSEQKSQAMSAVIHAGNEADVKQVEALILENPGQHFEQAATLVRKQKSASKPFLDKFRKALLDEQVRQGSSDAEVAKGELPAYLKEQMTMLEGLASGKGATELLDDYVTGKLNLGQLSRQLNAMSRSSENNDKTVDAILAAVPRLPKGEGDRKWRLLVQCMNFAQGMTDSRKEALRKILQEDPDAPVKSNEGTTAPLSQYVYWTADFLANDDLQNIRRQVQGLDHSELWPLWIARGRATLEGTPMPPTPSGADVPADRRKAMVQALDTPPDKGWAEYVNTLSLNEKIALSEELRKAEFKPAWREQALVVVQMDGNPKSLLELDAIKALTGQKITPEATVKLAEACRNHLPKLGEGQGIRVFIMQKPFYQGLRVQVEVTDALEENEEGEYDRSLVSQGARWMKELRSASPEAVPVNGYASLRWMQGPREAAIVNWHLDKDAKWQNWASTEHEELGRAPGYGTAVPEADIAKALEERIKTWNPATDPFWIETGAVRPPAAETPDKKTPDARPE
ncbi:hypothetical protein [Verrucomicrobium sp. BvORR034]|uniref:hypothetical protein n=1 Tax=Verrucomicrobium sp. BvORR034 TaxID=1396418 RepID=UPI000679E17B|nr:hypothetical protein [Verrucomicrobium sp. BvORR034]